MTIETEDRVAVNRRAAISWRETVGEDLPVGVDQNRPSHVVLDSSDPQLLQTIATMLSDDYHVSLVCDHYIGQDVLTHLTNAGFTQVEDCDIPVLSSPRKRQIGELVTAAIVGPIASRQFAGVWGVRSAHAGDLGIHHRTLVYDNSPMATWMKVLSDARRQSSQLRLATPLRAPVSPLYIDGDPRVTVDTEEPGPVLLVGDRDLGTLDSIGSSFGRELGAQAVAIRGTGNTNDAVDQIRSARRSLLVHTRSSSGVVVPRNAFRSELDRAAVVVDTVDRGVPVLADFPESMKGYLGERTIGVLSEAKAETFGSLFERDRLAVRLFRAAALDAWSLGYPIVTGAKQLLPEVSVSIILATIRPEMVPVALSYIDAQTFPDFDVVVAVHGDHDVARLQTEWESRVRKPLRVVGVPGVFPLGLVYNEGIAAADASVITIWDDDDYYGPNHLWDLMIALRRSRADVVGKGAEFFYLESIDLTVQRSPQGRYARSDFIGGSNLTTNRATVRDIGGFSPIGLGVDREFIERITRSGGSAYRDHGYGYLVHRRAQGHTWNPGDAYFLDSSVRQWRGLDLEASGVSGKVG